MNWVNKFIWKELFLDVVWFIEMVFLLIIPCIIGWIEILKWLLN